ncbi:hypothetical protein Hdeb2414_s0011g00359811 [Helianthus debilis subsp. tardiflorus]
MIFRIGTFSSVTGIEFPTCRTCGSYYYILGYLKSFFLGRGDHHYQIIFIYVLIFGICCCTRFADIRSPPQRAGGKSTSYINSRKF